MKFRPQMNFLVAEQTATIMPPPPRPGDPPPPLIITEEFTLLNTQLNLPISFTSNTWDIEVGWNLNLPNAIRGEGSLDTTNFFSLTVGYLFDLSTSPKF